jgi:tetratricopeptide (TPR) repeat protein
VLRRADPGPWLDAFRDPAVRNDPLRLWWLARSADPTRLPPATLTALAEVMRGRGLDPVPLLLRAQFAHPGDFLIPFHLGRSAEDAADQVAHYRAARVTRPGNLAVLNNLGNALKDKGDVDGAIAAYKEAITHDPTFAPAHYNLGVALHVTGDPDGAIAAYKEAIKHDPELAQAHLNLGITLTGRDLDGAIATFKEALKLDPGLAQAHDNLGWALYQKKDFDGAIAEYKEAIRLNPKYSNAHYNLGWALTEKRDFDGAIAEYKEAIRLYPKHVDARVNLGTALYVKKDFDGAIAEFKVAIRLNPKNANAHNNLGYALYVKKDLDGAIAEFKVAIRLNPKNANAHNNLAWILAAGPDGVRDGTQAVEHATRACELTDWKDPDRIDTLAAAYAEAGDFDKAVEYQKRALSFPAFEKRSGPQARKQLDLFVRKKPYRDPTLAPREPAPPPRPVERGNGR